MNYIRMIIALLVTLFIIIKVNNKKELIIPVCILYYFIAVLNDIFNAGTPIHLADAFGVSYQFSDTLLLVFLGDLLIDIFCNPFLKRRKINFLLAYLTTATMFSMFLGIMQYGMNSEWMGDLRTIGLFITALLYFSRFYDIAYIKKYLWLIDTIMNIILLISIILWGLDIFLGIHVLASQYNGTLSDGGSTMRFIQSYEVLGIAIYALYLIRKDIRTNNIIGIKSILYSGAVIFFQHRSVWVAFGIGVIVILLSEFKYRKIALKLFLQIIFIAFLCTLIVILGSGNINKNIQESFSLFGRMKSGASLDNTTAGTRIAVWKAVLVDLTGMAIFFGRPFGYGYAINIGWSTSPHSGYIRMLGRTGYAGLTVILLLLGYLMISMIKKQRVYAMEFLVCVTVFAYSYDFTWLCGSVIGCCVALVYKNDNHILNRKYI